MTALEKLYQLVDNLPREELEQLNRYIQHRRQTRVWEVAPESMQAIEVLMRPTHELTATMSDEEIDAEINEALDEVRSERQTTSRD